MGRRRKLCHRRGAGEQECMQVGWHCVQMPESPTHTLAHEALVTVVPSARNLHVWRCETESPSRSVW